MRSPSPCGCERAATTREMTRVRNAALAFGMLAALRKAPTDMATITPRTPISARPTIGRRHRRLAALPLAAALAFSSLLADAQTAPPAPAASAASAAEAVPLRALRPEVATPVQAAQVLLGERKGPEALAKLAEAAAVPGLTAWETWVVERSRAVAAQMAGEGPLLLKSLEAALLTRQADPAEELQLVETLVGTAAREKDYARVIRWGRRYEELGGTNDAVRVVRIQSLAASGDAAGAKAAWLERQAAVERAGQAMPENHLLQLLGLQFRTNDPASMVTLERLVTHHPRPEYWADLVSAVARQPNVGDKALLELYRLLRATRNLRGDDLYVEMAQLALRAGQPAEAQTVLDEGYAAGLLGKGAQAAAHGKLREQVRRAATADKADRPGAEAAARRAADGTALADLGWSMVAALGAEAGAPATEPGLAMIEQGVAKGGLKRATEAQLHLGMAQLAAGRKDMARRTLGELAANAGDDPLAGPIRLWNLYAKSPPMLPARQ